MYTIGETVDNRSVRSVKKCMGMRKTMAWSLFASTLRRSFTGTIIVEVITIWAERDLWLWRQITLLRFLHNSSCNFAREMVINTQTMTPLSDRKDAPAIMTYFIFRWLWQQCIFVLQNSILCRFLQTGHLTLRALCHQFLNKDDNMV